MASGTTDDFYFEWLYSQIGATRNRNPARAYWNLCRQMYTKEFVWFVANDDNRLEDGKELRLTFMDEWETDEINPEWMDLGCSVLEMLIALARRASFETEKEPAEWFGIFMDNLGLTQFNDQVYTDEAALAIDDILECVIYRNYNYDGQGGLFPLENPDQDQTRVELWYQMSAYLLERSLV